MKSIQCPYCVETKDNEAGMSAHVKYMHPDKWKGTLVKSIPDGYLSTHNLYIGKMKKQKGTKTRKGMKKPKIYNKCPWCPYKSDHPPGLSRHIKCNHPDHWKGNLGSSLGREPSRRWKLGDKPDHRILQRRAYNTKRREQFIAMGLTSSGSERKRPIRAFVAERYSHVLPSRKIKPIVYHAPITEPTESSLMDRIIERVAQKLADKLLE